MNKFKDKHGMYHDKACKDYEPSSNNGWIYTAYAVKLNLPVDLDLVKLTFNKCVVENLNCKNGLSLIRTPYRECPPISRDEILGMAAIGFLKPYHLNGWNFSPFPIPKFNLLETINQFLKIRNKDRNYFWKNNMSQIYRFAFSVPFSDRHFILKKWGKFNLIYWLIAKIDSKLKGHNGIPWLKYGGDNRKSIMKEEFPNDHPFKYAK